MKYKQYSAVFVTAVMAVCSIGAYVSEPAIAQETANGWVSFGVPLPPDQTQQALSLDSSNNLRAINDARHNAGFSIATPAANALILVSSVPGTLYAYVFFQGAGASTGFFLYDSNTTAGITCNVAPTPAAIYAAPNGLAYANYPFVANLSAGQHFNNGLVICHNVAVGFSSGVFRPDQ